MPRGNTDLSSREYDSFLADKANKGSTSARHELEKRKTERRNAHDGKGVGYHFGIDKEVVKAGSPEEFKHELNKRGLMVESDVKKNLRGPGKHEFKGRIHG